MNPEKLGFSFIRVKATAFFFLLFSISAFSGEAFKYSEPIPESFDAIRTDFIAKLKNEAVRQWLKKYLGDQFAQYSAQINDEMGEKYILEYQIHRLDPQGNRIKESLRVEGERLEVAGTLDSDALKKWARLAQSKTQGNRLHPMILLTSELPESTGGTAQLSALSKAVPAFGYTLNQLSEILRKFGVESKLPPSNSFENFSEPARSRGQIATLRNWGNDQGFNSALWAHFEPCPKCGGAKVEFHLYEFRTSKISLTRTHSLSWPNAVPAQNEKLKETMETVFSDFETAFKNLVSGGTLDSRSFTLAVLGIPSYPVFKQIEKQLETSDLVTRALVKRVSNEGAEFEVQSPLPIDEFSQKVATVSWGNISLKLQSVDSNRLTLKYTP